MATIEALHSKFAIKFNALEDFGKFLKKIDTKYNKYAKTHTLEKQHKKSEKNKSSDHVDNTENVDKIEIPKKNNYKTKVIVSKTPKTSNYCQWILDSIDSNVVNLNNIDAFISKIASIYSLYTAQITPILSEYYDDSSDNTKNTKLSETYKRVISSENYIDKLNAALNDVNIYINSLEKNKLFIQFVKKYKGLVGLGSFSRFGRISKESKKSKSYNSKKSDISDISEVSEFNNLDYKETIAKFIQIYNQAKVNIAYKKQDMNICTCGKQMTIFANESERRCNSCGIIVRLHGAIFDDSQAYTQQGQCTKHKEYDSNKHCFKWLTWIQAKEKNIIPDSVIEKIAERALKDYTRFGKLQPMDSMKCQQIRKWLKDLRLTKWNHHAPLIRKLVTAKYGKPVIPPQFSPDEEQEVLIDFSQNMEEFEDVIKNQPEMVEEIFKKTRSNRPYYPYGLWQVVMRKFRRDERLKGILECIHLQSDATLKKHDRMHKIICSRRKGYKYEPTDRALIDELYY